MAFISIVTVLTLVLSPSIAFPVPDASSVCRCMPGDSCWPSVNEWQSLNETVGGRLISSVPLAEVCHIPKFDQLQCANLRDAWTLPQTFMSTPSSVMLPLFQDEQCNPFAPPTDQCTQGNLVAYSLDVSGASDAAAALDFAQKKNLRVVIKNTGHDFLGRSSGKGGLEFWTHNLKSTEIIPQYTDSTYTGPAMKMGAGVQAFDALAAAHQAGYRAIGGDCSTVGVAGGYSSGAGHGPLATTYGLAADQVLSWEVITANGEHLDVSADSEHPDLYWALTGGGGGTYALVLSMTAKIYDDGPVAGASLVFNATGVAPTTYWSLVEQWQSLAPSVIDSGSQVTALLTNQTMTISPITMVDKTTTDLQPLLEPFISNLKASNISYSFNPTNYSNYYDHFDHYLGPLPYGAYPVNDILGSRLIPRSVADTNSAALTSALRQISDLGFSINILGQNVSNARIGTTADSNSVLPAWRDTIFQMTTATTWNFSLPRAENVAKQQQVTDTIIPLLEELTPGSGVYSNEADVNTATWQEDFFGGNWERLNGIKLAYDPEDTFYSFKGVGSQRWELGEDGRLCQVGG